MHALRNGYLTAASTPLEQAHGFVFRRGRITGEPGVTTYLGRPWRDHAQTTFVETEMSGVVRPEGWHNWDKPERETSSRYREALNTGPGADGSGRVKWTKPLSAAEARALTPLAVLRGGDGWDPASVPSYASMRAAHGNDAKVMR